MSSELEVLRAKAKFFGIDVFTCIGKGFGLWYEARWSVNRGLIYSSKRDREEDAIIAMLERIKDEETHAARKD